MGYDATVFLIFGVQVSFEAFATFARSFITSNPIVLKDFNENDQFDLEDDGDVLEYVDDYSVDIEKDTMGIISLLLGNYTFLDDLSGRFIACYQHEHSVCWRRDDPKEVTLPSEETKRTFI